MESLELGIQVIVSQHGDRQQALEAGVHVAVEGVVFQAHYAVLQLARALLLADGTHRGDLALLLPSPFVFGAVRGLSCRVILIRVLVVDVHLLDVVMILVDYHRLWLRLDVCDFSLPAASTIRSCALG